MTTTRHDKEFAEAISEAITKTLCGEHVSLLDAAIDWMSGELSPDDVFSEKQMAAWADESGFVEGGER